MFDGEGIAASPLWVWVVCMVLMFEIGLFVFAWKQPIARWVAGGFILSALSGELIFNTLGLPFLSGSIAIMYLIFWTPGLIFLLVQRPFSNPQQGRWFRVWAGAITCMILFSFFFDVRDAAIYMQYVSRKE